MTTFRPELASFPGIGGPDPDWDFFLPDDEAHPEPGDFWLEPDDDE